MTPTQHSCYFGRLALAAAVALLPAADAVAQEVLDVSTLTKYVDPLPNPMDNIIAPTGTLDGNLALAQMRNSSWPSGSNPKPTV